MQDSPKTIGAALLEVIDAGKAVVVAEINSVIRMVSQQIKQKGIGVLLFLVALVPLSLSAFFVLLSMYQALLIKFAPWAASLIMSALALLIAAVVLWLGMKKLSGDTEK